MSDELVYSIAETAERLGISYRSLRYYEDYFGIQINRDSAGDRVYSEANIDVLEKIIDLKKKDMTLKGIKKLLQDNQLIPLTEGQELVVVDEKALEFKDFILNEIRDIISQETQELKLKLDQSFRDNEELRQELRKLSRTSEEYYRTSEEHYSKIDEQLAAWRNKKPWYKKIFKE